MSQPGDTEGASSTLASGSRDSEWRDLVESVPDGIFVHAGGRFIYANAAGLHLLGASRAEEVIGLPFIDVVAPEYRDFVRARVERLEREGGVNALAHQRILRLDGRELDVEVASRLGLFGGRRAVLAVVRDVSDRVRLEQEREADHERLRQAAKMEAVGQLAGGVAHDFNNLLTVINSCADSVARAVQDPALRAELEEIGRAGHRAAALTRQLLAFSRRSLIHPQVLRLDQILAEMGKLLQRTLGEQVQLFVRSAPGLWNVKADPGQMEQVAMNLALNARDAMPRGGKLAISLSNVALDGDEARQFRDAAPGDYVMLEIEDTGVGMTEETLSRIFEPFFTTKAAGRGTGLGLATVFGIVKRAAGHIAVASVPGRGSTFQILLPRTLETPSVERLPVPTGSLDSGKGRTVLVVEDDAGVRALVTRILTRHGYTVIEAGSASDALVLHGLHAREIDLVITDVVMPRMSGAAMAEELRRVKPDQRILFVSGYADDMLGQQGILQEGVYHLPKPFSEAELLRDVRALIEGVPERARSPKTGSSG